MLGASDEADSHLDLARTDEIERTDLITNDSTASIVISSHTAFGAVRLGFGLAVTTDVFRRQPKCVAEINRIPTRNPVEIQSVGKPDRVFLRKPPARWIVRVAFDAAFASPAITASRDYSNRSACEPVRTNTISSSDGRYQIRRKSGST
jgi:hypothetical protein